MLNWANQFSICCFLDNNEYQQSYHSYECLLAVNPVAVFTEAHGPLSASLAQFLQQQNDWLFGHFSYHSTIPGYTENAAHLIQDTGFPAAFLFRPETVIEIKKEVVRISCLHSKPEEIWKAIWQTGIHTAAPTNDTVNIQSRFSRKEYLQTIQQLQAHIQRGDCYEINFCQEFYATQTRIQPVPLYQKLTRLSPTPYAAFYKVNQQYALCASPERYLKKQGNTLISQPIKGTAKRIHDNPQQDHAVKEALYNSPKERSENVMVVDLVRNDFSRICLPGTVTVEELFGIYSFPQVHQLISTIKGELPAGMGLASVLEATFPMGSMTGAPKNSVIALTNRYERTQRGLYSGCIGYVSPDGDFDWNVVIRSILYNAQKQYLSYQVGGGITFYSNAEQEYEECLLKAAAIKKALE